MTSTRPNPFTMKVFVIIESSPVSSCTIPSPQSMIIFYEENSEVIKMAVKAGSTVSQPMNILEVEQYLSTEINKFFVKLKLARTCDDYALQSMNLPANCTSTFKNFTVNQSQFGLDDNILDKFIYTDSYISSQQNANDKKHLCQRLRDLQLLLAAFKEIMGWINRPEIKEAYPDDYRNIMQKYQDNVSMRSILEQKLDNIYSTESSNGNSKRMLDSTIYTSVLWTILATTFVFYIFKKM